jgi:hypothetical protein
MLRQLKALAGAALLLPMLSAEGAACTLIATGGTLGLAPNGTTYTSELGLPSLVTISTTLLDGSFTITIDPPTLVQSPVGFVPISLEQKTVSAVSTLDLNFAYTSGQIQRTFPTQLLSAAVVTLHHRLNAASFPSGTYRTKTVVTCS